MSRSVFANTIGAFVLESDITPKKITRQNGFDAGGLFDAVVEAGSQEAKRQVVQTVEDKYGSTAGQVAGQAVDAGLDKAGIGTSNDVLVVQPQQSSTTANRVPIKVPSFMLKTPAITTQQLQAGTSAVLTAQQLQQQRKAELARMASNVATGANLSQSQVTSGENSQDTKTPKKPKKPFFKTGAGIATILAGAAAITGGVVYFAKK